LEGEVGTMTLPNFLIVGAAKSGTTSIAKYLAFHPQVYMAGVDINLPELKMEPSYFCSSYGVSNRLQYQELFKQSSGKIAVGESSHSYLTSPESAEWIRRDIPDAKIIIILRDPISRAFSLYNWMRFYGYEWAFPFSKAIVEEEKRYDSRWFRFHAPIYFRNYFYLKTGLYYEQVLKYLKVFSREKVLILLFDDLVSDYRKIIIKIANFLEIDNEFPVDPHIYNTTNGCLKLEWLNSLFAYGSFLKNKVTPFHLPIISSLRYKYLHLNISEESRYELGDYREKLKPFFKEDLEKLSNLIVEDCAKWVCDN
jgi:hypothetical protein